MAARVTPAGNQVAKTPDPVGFANGIAGGWIGYVSHNADQTVTTETNLTNLSVTVTVNTGRRIKISFDGAYAMSSGAGNRARFSVKEGATVLKARLFAAATNGTEAASFWFSFTPTPGTHTYNVTLASEDGGNAVLKASNTFGQYAELLVEDIGSVS